MYELVDSWAIVVVSRGVGGVEVYLSDWVCGLFFFFFVAVAP